MGKPENAYLLELKDLSCYVLTGDARYRYRHGVGRVIGGNKYKKGDFERVSLTLRHVIDSRRKVDDEEGR